MNQLKKFKSVDFDLLIVEIASRIADYGCFILLQQSTLFEYSGLNSLWI